ncbi:MAG: universal stress protein [Bacteroidetes bacterium]|nr:universal stress protein [Bacteroidota bacterium]
MIKFESRPVGKILVPTDFSEPANKALNYAASLAVEYGAQIILFHVNEAPMLVASEMAFAIDYSEMDKDIMVNLEQEKKKIIEKYHYSEISIAYTKGVAALEIISLSEKEHVDMIVMGVKGSNVLNEILIGSLTTRIISKSTCPVLAVPMDAPSHKPDKVAFATNFNDHELQSLFVLSEMIRPFNAEICVVHVSDGKESHASHEIPDFFVKQVRTNIPYDKISFHTSTQGSVEDALEKFIKDQNIDWLATAKRKRNFFERLTTRSLTSELAFHTHVPLLAFHIHIPEGVPLF